jgi:ribose transport system ATP-binding protein
MSEVPQSETPLLEMQGITKRFPGVVALQGVSLSLRAGEVLALMGENGAGKSTLMKVLGGVYSPDEGEIQIDGKPVAFGSVKDSKQSGIALIHQELMLAPNLDITSNIFLGNEGVRRQPIDGQVPVTAILSKTDVAAMSAIWSARGRGCVKSLFNL